MTMDNFQDPNASKVAAKEIPRTRAPASNVITSSTWSLIIIIAWSLLTCFLSPVSGTITVISEITNKSVIVMEDMPARFVPERVSFYGIQGRVIGAEPPNACTPVQRAPDDTVNWILVVRRYDCDFQVKIENAQNAGYNAVIIHNVDSNSTEPIGVDDPSRLIIYACFVGEYYGRILREKYSYPHPFFIRIQDDFSFNGYLLPFAIVMGACFVILLVFMVRLLWQQLTRWIRERRRSRRRKLPASALKKLPITKWTKGDPYETCAICLEDFVEQDKVRVLPCSHGFHTVCIDPWLTKGRRVCPICKRKVILADERFSGSDTDTDDETAPLLRPPSTSAPPNPATSGSTFVQQRENPFRRARRLARGLPGVHTHRTNTSDTSSTGSSSSSDGSAAGPSTSRRTSIRTESHRSLPVLAQVHSMSLPSSSRARAASSTLCIDGVPAGALAPHPSLQYSSESGHCEKTLPPDNNNLRDSEEDTGNEVGSVSINRSVRSGSPDKKSCSISIESDVSARKEDSEEDSVPPTTVVVSGRVSSEGQDGDAIV